MVTITVTTHKSFDENGNRKYVNLYDVRCNSTDTKPTTNVPNGSTCFEMDITNRSVNTYLFDADNSQWCAV